MSGQKRFTRYIGVAISILGLAVIALGVFFVTAGLAAKSEVQAAMAEEGPVRTQGTESVRCPIQAPIHLHLYSLDQGLPSP